MRTVSSPVVPSLVACLACLLASCGRAPDGNGINVVLIAVDTLRADRLGCYGWHEPTSPNVDRLATEGVLFEGMRAQSPQTQPSFSTILTGTHPPTHGVRANGLFALPSDALTLAEILSGYGYRTGAAVGGFPLDARFGVDQGFDSYEDEMRWNVPMRGLNRDENGRLQWVGHETRNFESSAEQVTDDALRFLDGVGDRRFLLMVHYFDPHHDYVPPDSLARRFSHPYAGEVAKVDREIGRVIERLSRAGLAEDTLVVFTADHGECLGLYDRYYHQRHLVEATVHVPFVMRLPGRLPAGVRVAGLSRSVDILPTVLELLDLEIPPSVEGRSLLRAVERRSTDLRLAYFETMWGRLESDSGVSRQGVTDGEWKLIYNRREDPSTGRVAELYELYDLTVDPYETQNVARQYPRRLRDLRWKLGRFLEAHPARRADVQSPDPEVVERLRALGYL